MKKIVLAVVLVAWFGLNVGPAQAHVAGQPPFFRVNGKFADLYPIPSTSLDNFDLPQDMSPESYLVNTPIVFEIDYKALGVTEEVFKSAVFSWDFGDGGKGTGGKLMHEYKTPGSYLLKIMVVSKELPTPQLFQSVLVNIVPDPSYVLPTATIKMNGENTQGPATIKYVDLSKPIRFEAKGGDTYFWDFGDATAPSTQQSVEHSYPVNKYPGGLTIVSALLRVTNKDGFFADNYVMLYDQSLKPTGEPSKQQNISLSEKPGFNSNILIIGGITVLLLGVGYIVWRKS